MTIPSFLNDYFILGDIPLNAETGTYILPFVFLSYVIATIGSFSGLSMASEIHRAPTERLKKLLHIGGAFAFGAGVWSMHFVGMLAYDMNMVHTYDPLITALSMLLAVGLAYGVLAIIRSGRLNIGKLLLGSSLIGLSICGMHYSGMAAMEMDADLKYIPSLFILSAIIAVSASAAALIIIFVVGRHEGKWKVAWQILAALVMGAAICGMHYTGMEASVFIPYADCRYDTEQSFYGLAMIVSSITILILIISLFSINRLQKTYLDSTDSELQLYATRYSLLYPVILSIVLGLTLTLLAHSYTIDSNQKKADHLFHEKAQHLSDNIYLELKLQADILYSIDAYFNSSNFVDKDEFKNFTSYILKNKSDLKSIFFIPQITTKNIPSYLAANSDLNPTNFNDNDGIIAPIQYIAPYSENSHFIGMQFSDMFVPILDHDNGFSKIKKLSALTNTAIFPIKSQDNQNSLIFINPFHINNIGSAQKYFTDKALLGLSYDFNNIVKTLLNQDNFKDLYINIYMLDDAHRHLIFSNSESKENATNTAWYTQEKELFNQNWSMEFWPVDQRFGRNLWQDYIMLILGLVLTTFISAYAYIVMKQRLKDRKAQ